MRPEETSLIESHGFHPYDVYLYRPDAEVSTSEVISALAQHRVIAGVIDASRIAEPRSILLTFLIDEDDHVICEDPTGDFTPGPLVEDFLPELAQSTKMWIELDDEEVITPHGETETIDEPARVSTARIVTVIPSAAPDVAVAMSGPVAGTSWYTIKDNTTVHISPTGLESEAIGEVFTDNQLPALTLIRAGEVWRAQWSLTKDGFATFGIAVGPDLDPVTHFLGDTPASRLAAELSTFARVTEEQPTEKFKRSLLDHPIHKLINRSDELTALPGELFLQDFVATINPPAAITRIIVDHLNSERGIELTHHGEAYGLVRLEDLPEDPDALKAIAMRSRVLYEQAMGRKPTIRSLIFGTSMGVILRSAAAVLGAIALAFVAWFMWEDPESSWFERYGSIGFALYVLWVAVKTPRELPHLRRAEAFVPKGDSPFL
ncbi:hypothetical protein [Jonesia quinghaiensis]|uniref:hypothetical protein n=1 Tax=Jonesia quinghaiensis TaxID=262806 RepID=UPI00040B3B7B|nr:hypothetical protein [Jonesia quinghaiensis]